MLCTLRCAVALKLCKTLSLASEVVSEAHATTQTERRISSEGKSSADSQVQRRNGSHEGTT